MIIQTVFRVGVGQLSQNKAKVH
uniref:Uncharacterized protein n=1 Tax=Arundo donax TaxID=35708 RepID=A0A0A9AKT8_ARUDO